MAGWGNTMPSYLDQLSERDIDMIVAFMQTLSDKTAVSADGEPVTSEDSTSVPEDSGSDDQP